MPTEAEFLDLYPEFDTVPAALLTMYFNLALKKVSQDVFGDVYTVAVYLFLAHILTISGYGGSGGSTASGPVVMEKVGDITIKYADVSYSSGDEFYGRSKYGVLFSDIAREFILTMNVARC